MHISREILQYLHYNPLSSRTDIAQGMKFDGSDATLKRMIASLIQHGDVIVEGNYLVFETNHFSTYIIGGNAIKNPATSDSFVKLSIAFLISLFLY